MSTKMKEHELIEEPLFEAIQILAENEDETTPNPYKLMTIRGTASKGDHVNRNRRRYSTSLLSEATERAQSMIGTGKFLGEVEHPEVRGSLARAAVKFTRLWMEGDTLFYEGDVLPTEDGRLLETLLRAGVGVGVSTRGYGSVRAVEGTDRTMIYEVQSDFELKGIDFVLEESNEFGKVASFEHVEGGKSMTLEELQKEHPELFAQIQEQAAAKAVEDAKASLDEEYEQKLAAAIEEAKAKLAEEFPPAGEGGEPTELDKYKNAVAAVVECVRPFISEVGEAPLATPEMDELAASNESLKAQVEALQGVVDSLTEAKETLEAQKLAEETAKAVAAKVDEMVEGHRFADQLREKLAVCETVEAVEEAFSREVAFIEALTENVGSPAGSGVLQSEEDKTKMDEAIARQRQLAGITEGGKE